MQTKKTFITLILCLLIILQARAYDFEEDGIFYNFISGTNNVEVTCGVTHFYSYTGEIVIPAQVTYSNVVYNVTKIGERAFYSPPNAKTYSEINGKAGTASYPYLKSIVMPTSLKSIGKEAFMECIGLTSADIPVGVTNVGDGAFLNCGSLTTIVIPNTMINIGKQAFMGCSLTAVSLPNSVVSIGEKAFMACIYLSSINIPSKVAHIEEYTFYSCNLNTINIPEGVTCIAERAFGNCRNLASISFPSTLNSIGDGAFEVCNSLVSLFVPHGVTYIGNHAFDGCQNLSSISLPNSLVNIENYAFRGCSHLKKVELEWESPLDINVGHFYNVDLSHCTLYVPKGAISKYKAAPIWQNFGIMKDVYLFSYRNSLSFMQTGGKDNISIRSGVAWNASSSADWINISPASGNGSEKLMVSVEANANNIPRFAEITVSGIGTGNWVVRISQEAQGEKINQDYLGNR